MGNKIIRLSSFLFASILSGVLLFLAFPKYDQSWLAWIGLVPLLLVIHSKRPKHAFVLSLLSGIVFFAGIFNWILEVPGYELHHHAVLIPYLALYFGIFGLLFSILANKWNLGAAFLAAPFLWVSLEYFRSNFTFLALPWALLAHSQYQVPSIIQVSSVTGAYGVSFVIVLVNSVLTLALLEFSGRLDWYRSPGTNLLRSKIVIFAALATAALAGLLFLHGRVTLSKPDTGDWVKVSVLQGNIDHEKKQDPKKYAEFTMQRYVNLTTEAAKDQPTLIVWPEAATPGFVLFKQALKNQVVSLIKSIKIHFLIGSSELNKFTKGPIDLHRSGNTALFFSPKGKLLGQYLKIHLVPFGEYIPYEGKIPWPEFIVPSNKTWNIPGKEFTLFDLNDGARFGVIICWENVFPDLFRTFVRNGANFMLNITNEGWFGDTAAPYQMLAISVFRAVENRVALARAANTGISCFIDPYGRITGRVMNSSKDTFVQGYLTQEVIISKEKAFYTMYGDIFVYMNLVVAALMVVLAVIFRRRSKSV